MADYENQHTVWKYHLRQFTSAHGEKILWRYSKSDPLRPRRISPQHASTESFFYSQKRADGTWDNRLEHDLAKVESNTVPSLTKLINKQPIDRDERHIVARYISLAIMRTRGPRDAALVNKPHLESAQFAVDYVQQNWKELRRQFTATQLENVVDDARRNGKGLPTERNYHLDGLFARADTWAFHISQMAWTIWEVEPPHFFVISDNPAFARNPCRLLSTRIATIGSDGVELGMPLSSRLFLLAENGEQSITRQKCSSSRTDALNTRTVLSAVEHVFAPQRCSIIEHLVNENRDFHLQYPEFTYEQVVAATKL